VLRGSKELGFLTGEENRTMNDAHVYVYLTTRL